MYDILIIGAGASGMAAAVTAARIKPDAKICLIEKKDKPGRKIAASGNGRCNIINTAYPAFDRVREFLAGVGILTREEEEGRVYPYSGQAAQVVDAFVSQLASLHVTLTCGTAVDEITALPDGTFVAKSAQGNYKAKKLLIACGGKSAPVFGTAGDGYIFARKLGHRIKRPAPVLTFLNTANREEAKALKGTRVKGKISLFRNDIKLAEEQGEVQFIETGVSGVAVFNLSRFVRFAEDESPADAFGKFYVIIDFMPDYERHRIEELLIAKSKAVGMEAGKILNTILPGKLADAVLARCKIEKSASMAQMTANDIMAIADCVSSFRIKLSGAGGWKEAQCTAGGVLLDEVNLKTMESKLIAGLYFSGEVLDYDGPCGGYNLGHAWETGMKAGMAMAGRGDECTGYTK